MVGGLVGVNLFGSITACYSTSNVTGGHYSTGGLVGINDGTISTCYSTGFVKGKSYVGGLVGERWDGDIVASFWDIETSGQNKSDGGTGLPTAEMLDINSFIDADWTIIPLGDIGTEHTWWIKADSYPQLWWQSDDGL